MAVRSTYNLRRADASVLANQRRLTPNRSVGPTGIAARNQLARDRGAAANLRLSGQLPEAPTFLAGRGASLQPEGFETSLGVARGLERVPQLSGIGGRNAAARGRTPGALYDPDSPETLLSGRIRAQKNYASGVAIGPESLTGEAVEPIFRPGFKRKKGVFGKLKNTIKGSPRKLKRSLPLDRIRERETILGTGIGL